MLASSVKSFLPFEPTLQNPQIPIHAHPHLPHFLSLPHSQNPYISTLNISNNFRTLPKNRGVYPQKANPRRNSIVAVQQNQRSSSSSPANAFAAPKAFSQSRYLLPGITTAYFTQIITEAVQKCPR